MENVTDYCYEYMTDEDNDILLIYYDDALVLTKNDLLDMLSLLETSELETKEYEK